MRCVGRLLLLATFVLTAMACGPESGSRPWIVGGSPLDPTEAARRSLVALAQASADPTGKTFCSGTLIAPRLVVTAAHCLEEMSRPLEVIFGPDANDLSAPRVKVRLSRLFRPDAARFYPNFDIAWLQLDADAPAPYRPIEILRDPGRLVKQLQGSDPLLLAGFGKTATVCDESLASCVGEGREVQTRLRRFVDSSHFRSLLLTGPTPGQGSCNGDSGGPAYAQVNGAWYLVGVLHGKNYLLNSKQVLKPEQTCESGESTYTFAGAYRDWIEATSGVRLPLDAKLNPPAPPKVPMPPLSAHPTLAEFLAYDREDSPIWMTADSLLKGFKDASKRIDPNFDELITDPKRAAAAMESWESFSAEGLTSPLPSPVPLDLQLSDLRPLAYLKNLKRLELSDHRIRDTSPLASLTQLEELKLSNNYSWQSKARIPWNLTFLAALPRLRVLNLLTNGASLDMASVPWAALTQLDTLILSNNAGVLDLNAVPWPQLKKLRQLVIINSELQDIRPLAAAVQLEQLNLRRNMIKDIEVLKNLKNLRILDVSENLIRDFEPVATLGSLEKLWAVGNPSESAPCPKGASCIYEPAN